VNLRESYKLGTETEAGTLTSSNTNSGGEEVEDSEDDSGEDSERGDLGHIELALRDDNSGDGNSETFDEILDHTSDNVRNHGVHLLIPHG
jgi:hypothetical protein